MECFLRNLEKFLIKLRQIELALKRDKVAHSENDV